MRGIGLIRLRIGIIGEPLWMRHWTSGFHKPWSWLVSGVETGLMFLLRCCTATYWLLSSLPLLLNMSHTLMGKFQLELFSLIACFSTVVSLNSFLSSRPTGKKTQLLSGTTVEKCVIKINTSLPVVRKWNKFHIPKILFYIILSFYFSWIRMIG